LGSGGEASGSGDEGAAGAAVDEAALAAQLQQPPVLRMAVCDLHKAEHLSSWRGNSYRVTNVDQPWRVDVLLPLDELGLKVVACFEGHSAANARGAAGAANACGAAAAVFVPFGNMSGSV